MADELPITVPDPVPPTPSQPDGSEKPKGDDDMAEPIAEAANVQTSLTAMSNGVGVASAILSQAFSASAQRRTDSADQLASDSQRMWSIAMTTPTVLAGLGYRTATEAGSGRTRAETNRPEETSAAGPVK
jgi:hypothetical protein